MKKLILCFIALGVTEARALDTAAELAKILQGQPREVSPEAVPVYPLQQSPTFDAIMRDSYIRYGSIRGEPQGMTTNDYLREAGLGRLRQDAIEQQEYKARTQKSYPYR